MATINRIIIQAPNQKGGLTFYNTDLRAHRATVKLLSKEGYTIIDDTEELANVESAEEALMIAKHHLPLKG